LVEMKQIERALHCHKGTLVRKEHCVSKCCNKITQKFDINRLSLGLVIPIAVYRSINLYHSLTKMSK